MEGGKEGGRKEGKDGRMEESVYWLMTPWEMSSGRSLCCPTDPRVTGQIPAHCECYSSLEPEAAAHESLHR